jgi:hypothetical protein
VTHWEYVRSYWGPRWLIVAAVFNLVGLLRWLL